MRRTCHLIVLGTLLWAPHVMAQGEVPAQPAPGPTPDPAQPPAPVEPAPAQPAPAQPAPPYAEPPPPQAPAYQQDPIEEPPLAEPQSSSGGDAVPDFGVRIDPLNMLLYGRMGLELEVELLEFLTVEAIPVFVTDSEPVLFPDDVTQESDGLGPMAGIGVDVGIWLSGDSFNGTVLRGGFSNYSYEYSSTFPVSATANDTDSLTHSEQRISVLIGSHRTWSWFTIAGAFGLEYETNGQTRCFGTNGAVISDCDDGEVLLRLSAPGAAQQDFFNANSSLYPYSFAFRFSLGVAIDD